MWGRGPDLRVLYVESVREFGVGDGDGDAEDVDDDVECGLVWAPVERDAVGGCGVGVWGGGGGGVDSKEGEGGEEEEDHGGRRGEEGVVGYVWFSFSHGGGRVWVGVDAGFLEWGWSCHRDLQSI